MSVVSEADQAAQRRDFVAYRTRRVRIDARVGAVRTSEKKIAVGAAYFTM